MSIDTNKAVVIASIDEGWNMQQLLMFDQLLDPDLVGHSTPSDLPATRGGQDAGHPVLECFSRPPPYH